MDKAYFINFLATSFFLSGIVLLVLRIVLFRSPFIKKYIKRELCGVIFFAISDMTALRLFLNRKKFTTTIRIILIINLAAWILSWTLPFLILSLELFL